MKYWRYQILRHTDEKSTWYGLHEIYLSGDGEIEAHTIEADVIGDTLEEIISTLEMMMEDAHSYAPIDEPEYGGLE